MLDLRWTQQDEVILIVAFQLRWLMLTARVTFEWTVEKSIDCDTLVIQWVSPVAAFIMVSVGCGDKGALSGEVLHRIWPGTQESDLRYWPHGSSDGRSITVIEAESHISLSSIYQSRRLF